MNMLEHIFEPSRLFLTWQAPLSSSSSTRTRRVVGEVYRHENNVVFRYLPNSLDYLESVAEGFKDFPAFNPSSTVHTTGVIDAFLRRLPSRKRDDFSDYLAQYKLPSDFHGSDLALLGYTNAKLPSDTFELCLDLSDAIAPIDLILEVAGLRHHCENSGIDINIGEEITFLHESNNTHDSLAIQILHKNKKIGYVNRVLAPAIMPWVQQGRIQGVVARKNGRPDRPLVFVLMKYR